MLRDKLVDVNDPYACYCQGKSGPGEIYEVILVELSSLSTGFSAQSGKENSEVG